jgi:hypothetical protein
MSKKEERVWQYLLQHRNAEYAEVADACGSIYCSTATPSTPR